MIRREPDAPARRAVLGLKGRFSKPRPKAWEADGYCGFGPERAIREARDGERPLQGRNRGAATTQGLRRLRRLRPVLTEPALQAEEDASRVAARRSAGHSGNGPS